MKKITVFVLGLLMVAPSAFARKHNVDLKKLTREIQEIAAQAKQKQPSAVTVVDEPTAVVPAATTPEPITAQTGKRDVRKPVVSSQGRTASFFQDLAEISKVKRDKSRFGYTPDLNTHRVPEAIKQLAKEVKQLIKAHPILNDYWLEADLQEVYTDQLEELKALLSLSLSAKNAPQKADKTQVPYYTLQAHNLFGTRFNVITVTLPQDTIVRINPIRRSITLNVDLSKVSVKSMMENSVTNSRSMVSSLDDESALPEDFVSYLRELEEVMDRAEEASITPELMRKMQDCEVSLEGLPAAQFFMILTGAAMEFVGNGQTPDTIPLQQLKEFYQASKEYQASLYVLPTIAIWHNGTIDGLMPYRHQTNRFWEIPQQVGKMYNTMAQIDPQNALNFLKGSIRADFEAATTPQFPEGDLGPGGQRQFVANFFAEFATGGNFACQDANELQSFTFKLLDREEETGTPVNE